MREIGINNQTELKIDKKFVRMIARSVLKEKKINEYELSVVFVKNDTIRGLNKKYRNQDKVTDVLSFEGNEDGFLGEIVIAPNVIKQRGEHFQNDLEGVLIHAILHLLGYDHIERSDRAIMREEEKRLEKLNN